MGLLGICGLTCWSSSKWGSWWSKWQGLEIRDP